MRSKARLACLLLAILRLAPVSYAGGNEALRFSWALIYQSGEGSVRAIDYSSRIVRLASGDRFRIRFQSHSRCFTYVFLHDAQERLYLLGQRSCEGPDSWELSRGWTLPEGDSWYRLDDSSGVETLYLVVSAQPLHRLEALSIKALRRPAGQSGQPLLRRKRTVLEELRRLLREASGLAEPLQKPVTVAGEFRGITEEGEYQGVEVETEILYVRTIRLAH
jgi:hypothetical protein